MPTTLAAPLLIVWLWLCAVPALAQHKEATTYTLPMCLEMVLENAYSIRFARNAEEILANDATRGNAGMLPVVNAAAGFGGVVNQVQTAGDSRNTNVPHASNYNVGVNSTWTLFDGWGMQASYERLQEIRRTGELATRLQIETTIADATAMYYDIVHRQKRLENLQANLALSRERRRIAHENYMAGRHSQLEYLQAQVDFNADSSLYVIYLQGTEQLQIHFKQLLLLPFDYDDVITPDTTFSLNENLKLSEIIPLAQQNNTSLKIFAGNRTVTDLERRQVEAARYPFVTLNAAYGFRGGQNFNINTNRFIENYTIGLNYSVNVGYRIFDGYNQRRREANVRVAQLNRELEHEQQEQQVMADVHQLYSSYRTFIQLLGLERTNTALANNKISLAILLYSQGLISPLELREQQRTSLDAQDRLVNAMFQAKLSEIYLMQLCGLALDYLNIKTEDER